MTLRIGYDFDREENRVEVTSVRLAEMPLGWPGGDEWKRWDYTNSIDEETVAALCAEEAHDWMRNHPAFVADIIADRLLCAMSSAAPSNDIADCVAREHAATTGNAYAAQAEWDRANVGDRFE